MNDSLSTEVSHPIVQIKTKHTVLRFDTAFQYVTTKQLAGYLCRNFSRANEAFQELRNLNCISTREARV